MRNGLVAVLVAIAFLQPPTPAAEACSTFKLQEGDTLIYAHNLDEPGMRVPGIVYVNRRGVFKTGRSFEEIAVGERPDGFFAESVVPSEFGWISRYGSVTFSPWGRDFPDGGVNEAGLYIWEMGLAATRYPRDSGLPKLMQSNWVQYVLDTCGSIDEALEAATQFELMGMNWHFFLGDGQGNTAALEFLDGKAVVHRAGRMPVPVLFNQTYERDLKTLGFYRGFGGLYEPDLDDPRVPRIAKAATVLRDFDPARHDPLEYAKRLLFHVGNKPYKWGVLVDAARGTIHFNTESCQDWKHFSYRDLDYSADSPVLTLDVDQPEGGDVGDRFRPQRDEEVAASIRQFGLPDRFFQYFHTTRESFAARSATAYHEAERPERQYFRGLWRGIAADAGAEGEREPLQLELRTTGSAVEGTVRFRDESCPADHLKLTGTALELTFRARSGRVFIATGTIDGDRLRVRLVWTEGTVGDFILQRKPA